MKEWSFALPAARPRSLVLRRRGPRLTAVALVMSLVAVMGTALAASPAWAEPPPDELPRNASVANLEFQPYMSYDVDGCYPSVAVGADGTLNPGLETTGAVNGSCRDASDLENSNMYARSRCNTNGWCAHKYGLYFQKDQTTGVGCSKCGHRHDWEHIVVWTKDGRAEWVAASAHGKYSVKKASDVDFWGTHPKIVYHKDGGSTHAFRFSVPDEEPEDRDRDWHFPDLVSWNGYPSGVRDKLTGHDWEAATFALKDDNDGFRTDLEKAYKDDMSFPFDFYKNELPAGMPDPNTPPAHSLRVMALGSSTTLGEGSTDGNGYRNAADEGLNDLVQSNADLGPEDVGARNASAAALAEDSTPRVDWTGSQRRGTMADRDTEGWSGYTIGQIAGKATCAVKTYRPNLVTLNAGGNDVIQNYQMDGAIGRLRSLIEQIGTDSPGATVLVAGVQPLKILDNVDANTRGKAFTAKIPGMVEQLVANGRRVVYADTTGLQLSDIGSDGTHATDQGYKKIAAAFVKAAGEANKKGWIVEPGPMAPNAGDHPCGSQDHGSGSEETGESNPNKLGTGWDDRGVIQDKQYPSSSRFMMVDINKDRKAEFVAVDKEQNVRFWWNSGPSGKDWVPFVEGQNSYKPAAGAVGNQLRFGDVDGDGFPDCMIVDLLGRIHLYTWKGENPSGSRMCMNKYDGIASVFSNGPSGNRLNINPNTKIRFADVTGGGRDDYLLIQPDGKTLAWYNKGYNVDAGQKYLDWTPPQTISGALVLPREIRYADINGDRRADRILITAKGGARAWINEGATGAGGTYRDIGRIAGDAEVPPKDVQFADLNGDGKADFLRIGWTGVTHAWLNELTPAYFEVFHP
jgi:lysophospholipase L1-like esterase